MFPKKRPIFITLSLEGGSVHLAPASGISAFLHAGPYLTLSHNILLPSAPPGTPVLPPIGVSFVSLVYLWPAPRRHHISETRRAPKVRRNRLLGQVYLLCAGCLFGPLPFCFCIVWALLETPASPGNSIAARFTPEPSASQLASRMSTTA